ncbi:YjbQ family protein [bacterium]|nr:YjbQ family protein [bacterium]
MLIKRIKVTTTNAVDMIEITKLVESLVEDYPKQNGLVNVYIPHTTAGLTINEAADPDVVYDLKFAFKRISPKLREYIHNEGNSNAHFLSTLVGCSINIPFEANELLLGTWQGIFLCEFDGPRQREVIISVN